MFHIILINEAGSLKWCIENIVYALRVFSILSEFNKNYLAILKQENE